MELQSSLISLWPGTPSCQCDYSDVDTSQQIPLIRCAPGLCDLLVHSVTDLPIAQRLMSGPNSMPSGQAQVYLGEWSVIWGAFRQRYSQPPLGRLPMLQVSGARTTQAETEEDYKAVGKHDFWKWFLTDKWNESFTFQFHSLVPPLKTIIYKPSVLTFINI